MEVGYLAKPMSLKQYCKFKIRMLKEDFKIQVTDEQKNHIKTLQSMPAIDRYCRTLIKNHWRM